MEIKEKILRIGIKCIIKTFSQKKLRWMQRIIHYSKQIIKENLKMNNALILYFSKTGNTKKVALAIKKGLEKEGMSVAMKDFSEASKEDLYDYDLVCIGSPVLHSLPPTPVFNYIKESEQNYRDKFEVILSAPKVINKNALVFVTYSGPHCGVNEALPAGKYIRQFFEHLGFDVKGEWYEVGEFHGWDEGSTLGTLGDIRGRPNKKDLEFIEMKSSQLAKSL